jgi:hypothetical protein
MHVICSAPARSSIPVVLGAGIGAGASWLNCFERRGAEAQRRRGGTLTGNTRHNNSNKSKCAHSAKKHLDPRSLCVSASLRSKQFTQLADAQMHASTIHTNR